jgi:hypothetical protein
MLQPSIRNERKILAGGVGSWLASKQLRRARLKRMRRLRWRHRVKRLIRAVTAAAAIFICALLIGIFGNGVGDNGVLVTILAMIAAFVLLAIFPRIRSPMLHDLRAVKLPALAGTTEAWLETQRPLLPAQSQTQVDRIGASLENLASQLSELDPRAPAAREVRGLLDEQLTALVESYVRIPETHRQRPDAGGSTPAEHLSNGLAIIARKIDNLAGQIARGEVDALATRDRYLETRYLSASEAHDG